MTLTLGAGGAAGAHANYLRSDPAPNAHLDAPPTRVLAGFSEKIQVASSGLALLDRDGREVASQARATGDPTELALPLPTLPGGVYTVAWHTVSAEDGDAAKGYFSFVVGTVTASTGAGTTVSATQGNVTVTLVAAPLVAGENGYAVAATSGNRPLPNVSRLRLRVTPLDRDIGQTEVLLEPSGTSFTGRGLDLPFVGRYRIQVQVRRSDTVDDLAFDFDLAVPGPGASRSPSVAPSSAVASAVASAIPAPTPASEPIAPSGTPAAGALLALVAVTAALAALAAVTLARRRR